MINFIVMIITIMIVKMIMMMMIIMIIILIMIIMIITITMMAIMTIITILLLMTMMIIITILVIIMIIKTPDFLVLQSPHCAVNCLQHAQSSGLGTVVCRSHVTHRALLMWNMCAVWYGLMAQPLRLTEFKPHLFSVTETISRWRRTGEQSTQRKPLITSLKKKKKPHTEARKFMPQPTLEPAL